MDLARAYSYAAGLRMTLGEIVNRDPDQLLDQRMARILNRTLIGCCDELPDAQPLLEQIGEVFPADQLDAVRRAEVLPVVNEIHAALLGERRRQVTSHAFELGSPLFWIEVAQRQLSRIERAQSEYAEALEAGRQGGTPAVDGIDARVWYPSEMAAEAAILVIAIHDIQRHASTPSFQSPRLVAVRDAHRKLSDLAPRLGEMRELIENVDTDVHRRDGRRCGVDFAVDGDLRGELLLQVADDTIRLKAAAEAAIALAKVLDVHIIASRRIDPPSKG